MKKTYTRMKIGLFIPLVLLAARVLPYVNTNGETGLYRMPTAEVLGPGNMTLNLSGALHGWDEAYVPGESGIFLWDENLSLTYGFSPYFECMASGKVHGDFMDGRNPISVGDARVAGKLIYPPYPHREEFELAIVGAVNAPTGSKKAGLFKRRISFSNEHPYSSGDPHLEFLFPLLVNFTKIGKGSPFKLHCYFGADFSTSSETHDMFQAGLGLEYLVRPHFIAFTEFSGETKTQKSLSPELDPVWGALGFVLDLGLFKVKGGGEYLLSVKEAVQDQIIDRQLLETGLYPHAGVFLNVALSGALVSQDGDKDGILDNADKCPSVPEDRDVFEDEDGCPDPDNDRDGIPDNTDQCPDKPEDFDGFQDQDGCPDIDNDNDGIMDASDRCINTPEDRDDFEDADGCPDPDNDRDGIHDEKDKCPNRVEDMDGFEDGDGCPDFDDDKDGIPDSLDRCPGAPETFNGIDDQDGCPDGRIPFIKINEIVLLPDVKFEPSETLTAASGEVLNELSGYLKNHPEIRLEIRSHTDALGSKRQNVRKSETRAEIVRAYLLGKGIDAARLTIMGVGEAEPVATNETAAGREKNNRVEIRRIQ